MPGQSIKIQDCPGWSGKYGMYDINKQEGHDGPVSLHWLIREIPSYQTLQYLEIALKHNTPYKD